MIAEGSWKSANATAMINTTMVARFWLALCDILADPQPPFFAACCCVPSVAIVPSEGRGVVREFLEFCDVTVGLGRLSACLRLSFSSFSSSFLFFRDEGKKEK